MLPHAALKKAFNVNLTFTSLSSRPVSRLARRPLLPKFKFSNKPPLTKQQRWTRRAVALGLLSSGTAVAYNTSDPVRYSMLATVRITRVVWAVGLDVLDYKQTLNKSYDSQDAQYAAYCACHKRSAVRLLHALQANGGIFIKTVSNRLTPSGSGH